MSKIKDFFHKIACWIANHTVYLRFLKKRMIEDDIGVLTSSLSYTTIMSLVPVLAVLLSVFSIFPGFDKLRQELIAYIMQNLMPQMGDVINKNINSFISQASNTTILGLFVLVIISLMLIRRVDLTLNKIWHTVEKRAKVTTFSVYWTVLTLGPILIGTSLALSSSLTAFKFFGYEMPAGINTFALNLLPAILTFIILTLLFAAVPTTTVKVSHAAIGAAFAAITQDLIKRMFTFYIMNFSSYSTVYGAVAAVPILMVWIHFNWYVVLIGAEISASIKAYSEITSSKNAEEAKMAMKEAETEVEQKEELKSQIEKIEKEESK